MSERETHFLEFEDFIPSYDNPTMDEIKIIRSYFDQIRIIDLDDNSEIVISTTPGSLANFLVHFRRSEQLRRKETHGED